MNPWLLLLEFAGVLLWLNRGKFGPPQAPMATIRVRVDNRRDNLPIETTNRTWFYLALAMAGVALTIFLVSLAS